MRKIFFVLTFLSTSISGITQLYAQSLVVGTPVLEDYYRRAQLLGKVDSNVSFTVRPMLSNKELKTTDIFDPDSTIHDNEIPSGNKRGILRLLPLSWQQQYNSSHPYGWNDGPMIPAKGYQTLVSGGFYFQYGFLSIQARPEYVYATNPAFEGYASGHDNIDIARYNAFHNLIDWPERFGNQTFKKGFIGQSSFRLTLGPISAGVSNENLWWGPGIKNALILTNNAAGFKHVTLNTIRPIGTFLGAFEGQVLAGRLDNSLYLPLQSTSSTDALSGYQTKRNDWRYFSGFNLNYHPKWISGFTFGLIRTFNAYYSDVKTGGFNAYVPFFTSYAKKNANEGVGDLFPRDQITSIYGRWVFTKAQAELYLEYGWEDNLYNSADFIQTPEHSRAYIFGFRKVLPLTSNGYLLVSSEITQTSQHTESSIREVGLWYVNYQLLQGHTHQGQVIGAGTGPGGNTQSLDISWFSGLQKFGLSFERFEHDVDFTQQYFLPVNGNSRNWVDFAIGLHGDISYKNFLFNAELEGIKSLNYQWILKDYRPDQYYIPHNNAYNFHGELGVTYRF